MGTNSQILPPQKEDRQWYIAIVNNHSEFKCAERLENLGITTYVPYKVMYSSKTSKRYHEPLIRARLLVNCTESDRREVARYAFIKRFMTDPAYATKNKPAVVKDSEIEILRFIVGDGSRPIEWYSMPLGCGDTVRVLRGELTGAIGKVSRINAKTSIVHININNLGCATVHIDSENLEKIPDLLP